MQKFNNALRGYDKEEVNEFLDKIITKVESMVVEINKKNDEIENLKSIQNDYNILKEKHYNYQKMEETLKRAIFMAEKTSEQIKLTAHKEREVLITDARRNADRIINEALLKSESIEKESQSLKRNVVILKRRLRDILETQLELVEDIEKIDI